MSIDWLYYSFALILILVGLAGVVLPALPGLPLVFGGMLVAAWAEGFQRIGWVTLTLLGILTALSFAVDFFSTVVGAQRVGASRKALFGAALGTFIGLFFGFIGLFAGPFIGALLGELWHSREVGQATKVGLATWLGILFGVVLKLGLAFAMLGLFVFAWFF